MTAPWSEGPWRPTAELDAATLLRVLVEHDVEFVVIGGFSVIHHGYVRATKDLDIVPNPDAANARRLYEALEKLGAEPRETRDFRPEEMPVQWGPDALAHGGNWVLLTRAGRIDILQWVEPIDSWQELRARAVGEDLPGIGVVFFASFEDLVRMKETADRPQDRADLDQLRRIREDPGA